MYRQTEFADEGWQSQAVHRARAVALHCGSEMTVDADGVFLCKNYNKSGSRLCGRSERHAARQEAGRELQGGPDDAGGARQKQAMHGSMEGCRRPGIR